MLNVILESFEQKPKYAKLFVPLLRAYMNDKKIIAEVLGSEYIFHRNSPDIVVPKSLYVLTAQLLQHELILLDDIYVYVSFFAPAIDLYSQY